MNWRGELRLHRKTTTRRSLNSISQLAGPAQPFRLGQAYDGKGDRTKAQDFYSNAQDQFLPALNYAFIRDKAEKLAKKAD